MDQPLGFVISGYEDKFYMLKKSLYWLKQAPKAWYDEINTYFNKSGFKRSPSKATLYIKSTDAGILIVLLYVNDIIYTGSSKATIEEFKVEMMKQYDMTNLRLLHHFLSLGVIQTEKSIFINQKKYAKALLEKFGLKDCKLVATPLAVNEKLCKSNGSECANKSLYMKIVGSLLY